MSSDEETHSPLSYAVSSTKKATNERVQCRSLNCQTCNVFYTKISSKEVQSPGSSCDDRCECKAPNNISLSSRNEGLSPNISNVCRGECNPLYGELSTDEEIHSPGFCCEDCECEDPSTNQLSDTSQSSGSETCIDCKGTTSTIITTYKEIHSRSCSCDELLNKDSGANSSNSQIRAMGALSPLDPSSYSRPELAIIKHISLLLDVNFESHVLSGTATINFEVLQDALTTLVLDTSNLSIASVELEDGSRLDYTLGTHLSNMGAPMTISFPKALAVGKNVTVKIQYSTSPDASALQWLAPAQTSSKRHPYLFSQCQPIHARSILPCQDTPAVKFTYDAEVTAPEEFTVLMSALRGEVRGKKTTFRQPMPLPSYLVAIAVGVLESKTLGPRSKVWSEKNEIERSAWEFAETEKYLQAAEKLCGPYEWTQYDLLVLPPSFPYGGMENPCLTFVTPTLLAGDRSQADVIVHEIMHSWTGNLVTNRNFEHFWLNEGFTVFLERKVAASLINDSVEAKKSRDFQSLLGLQELVEAIEVFGSSSPLTNLVVDLEGIHPDDAFSRVPYEKGSLFLRYLEDLVGGPEVFDDFLRSYLTAFRKKSLDTEQFKSFLLNYFKDNDGLKDVDWEAWLHTSGMPPMVPTYDTTMTKAITALLSKINDPNASISHGDVNTFTPHQMIHLLQRLIDQPALSIDRLRTLGTEYNVDGNKNTEILYRWLRLCVRSRDQTKLGEVFNFVNSQGRMKYVRPVYRDLYAWEDVREQAIDNFLKNEPYMMHVSAYTLRKDLHLAETNTA